ncbi:hypothetical protein ACLOJK_001748 [Asimina triloba]
MLLRCCNVASLRPESRRVTPGPSLHLRSTRVSVSCSSSSSARGVDLAGTPGGDSQPASASRPVEQLRTGRLVDDGLSYKENIIIRCYEVGINKTATVETMANLLQNSSLLLDVRGDVVEIETWCQEEGRIGCRRDWILKDYASGELIGRATSKFVTINQDTRRLERVVDAVREELLAFGPSPPRFACPGEDSWSLKKIPKLEDPAEYSQFGLLSRRGDLDMNHHVNYVTYIGWVLESMPQDVIDTHELQKITLDFRRECQHNDVVDSLTSSVVEETAAELSGTNGSAAPGKNENDCRQFLHFLRLSGDGLEINRGRTEWRRKPTRLK